MDTIKLRPVEKTAILDASCNFIRRAFIGGVPTSHIADVMNAAKIPDQQNPDFTPPVDNYRAWTEDLVKHIIRLTTLRCEEEILGLPPVASFLVRWHSGPRVTGLGAFHEPWAGASSGEDHEAHEAAVVELMADGTSREKVMERVHEEALERGRLQSEARRRFEDTFDLQDALDNIMCEASDDA